MSDSVILQVAVPGELHREAQRLAAGCGFSGVEDLILFLLDGVVQLPEKKMDAQEMRMVEERLRALGYL